jgi:16S rRNA (cytidine1402-2'-O)-methyltransferase
MMFERNLNHRLMLYLVGTPIGNLEDISERALRILAEVDAIGAEDTRHTRKLLAHFDIHTPTFSFHQHNERQRTDVIVGRLKNGEDIAIVSDAGMPLVSDAGQVLVQRLQQEQLPFTCVPGPSSVETALVLSGLSTDRFQFCGFIPREAKEREKLWSELVCNTCTVILFESPKRVIGSLEDMAKHLPERRMALARELTKLHEEVIRGIPADILRHCEEAGGVKGECVILVAPAECTPEEFTLRKATDLVKKVQSIGNTSRSTAAKIVAELTGIPRRTLYRESLDEE